MTLVNHVNVLKGNSEQDRVKLKEQILREVLKREEEIHSERWTQRGGVRSATAFFLERSSSSSSETELQPGPPTDDQGTSEIECSCQWQEFCTVPGILFGCLCCRSAVWVAPLVCWRRFAALLVACFNTFHLAEGTSCCSSMEQVQAEFLLFPFNHLRD